MASTIELHDVGKRYWQVRDQAMLLRSILPFSRPQRDELWALRHIDLAIEPGETVGVLGRNGSGKSTLLRLLASITRPTEGEVTIRGTVAPLISVGVGFHPEMSGRENVLVNGMLLGLTAAQVAERFDDIVAFAELGDFVDTPVKFYSSGMFMRLGFSVAVHTDPQVLLVDEVLAVGDTAFQLKCFERMRNLQSAGATIVLVSHSMAAIRLLCPRAAVLRHGALEFDGPVEKAISTHHSILGAASDDSGTYLHERTDKGDVRVADQRLVDSTGAEVAAADPDAQLTLHATLRFERDVDTPQVLFVVRGEDGALAYRAQSTIGKGDRQHAAGSTASLAVPFSCRLGGGGTFSLEMVVTDRDGRDVLGRSPAPSLLFVTPRAGTMGVADMLARIEVDGVAVDDHDDLTLGARGARSQP
jgi:ABC-type polysaccharide/polyol phosphate transport system ATPase subunit